MGHRRIAIVLLPVLLAMLSAGCSREQVDGIEPSSAAGPGTPTAAVRELTSHLVASDFAGFARRAVPPDLHARLDNAWREGRTRWPLDELPLAASHPGALAALAADDAEQALQRTFDRQFANAALELRQTAAGLGLFSVQFIQQQGSYSDGERQHFAQLITAIGSWAAQAPLSDRRRATRSIRMLAAAAREADLTSAQAFADAGIDEALDRLTPVVSAAKQALALYGLDLDAALSEMQVTLESQTGDTAKVRLQYTLADEPVDTIVDMERRDGRWYVGDFLVNAEAAVSGEPAAAPEGEPDGTPAATDAARP